MLTSTIGRWRPFRHPARRPDQLVGSSETARVLLLLCDLVWDTEEQAGTSALWSANASPSALQMAGARSVSREGRLAVGREVDSVLPASKMGCFDDLSSKQGHILGARGQRLSALSAPYLPREGPVGTIRRAAI